MLITPFVTQQMLTYQFCNLKGSRTAPQYDCRRSGHVTPQYEVWALEAEPMQEAFSDSPSPRAPPSASTDPPEELDGMNPPGVYLGGAGLLPQGRRPEGTTRRMVTLSITPPSCSRGPSTVPLPPPEASPSFPPEIISKSELSPWQ